MRSIICRYQHELRWRSAYKLYKKGTAGISQSNRDMQILQWKTFANQPRRTTENDRDRPTRPWRVSVRTIPLPDKLEMRFRTMEISCDGKPVPKWVAISGIQFEWKSALTDGDILQELQELPANMIAIGHVQSIHADPRQLDENQSMETKPDSVADTLQHASSAWLKHLKKMSQQSNIHCVCWLREDMRSAPYM